MSPTTFGTLTSAVTANRGIPLPTKPIDYGRRVYEHTPRPTGLDWSKHTAPRVDTPTPRPEAGPPTPRATKKPVRQARPARGPRARIYRIDADKVARLHADGLSTKAIAAELGCTPRAIRNAFARSGLIANVEPFIDEQQLAAFVGDGLTTSQIAHRLGIAPTTTRRHIARLGLVAAKPATHRAKKLDRDRAEHLHAAGLTATQIADELGVNPSSVTRYLASRGLRPITPGGPPRTNINPADAIRLYLEQEMSIPQVAKSLHTTPGTIRRMLTRNDIPLRDDRARFSGGGNRHQEETLRAAGRLYVEGLSRAEVAERLGVHVRVVDKGIRLIGATPRPAAHIPGHYDGVDRAAGLKELMALHALTAADVRAWAATTGRPCPTHGIPPRSLVEAYLLETHHRNSKERSA